MIYTISFGNHIKNQQHIKKLCLKVKFDLECKKARDVSMEFLSNFRASQSFQDRQKYIEKRNECQSL